MKFQEFINVYNPHVPSAVRFDENIRRAGDKHSDLTLSVRADEITTFTLTVEDNMTAIDGNFYLMVRALMENVLGVDYMTFYDEFMATRHDHGRHIGENERVKIIHSYLETQNRVKMEVFPK